MKHFFISYSRVDSAFVIQLVRDLDKRGIHVWLDRLDIPPGANWDTEIEKALDQCKSLIVVLSAVSAKSENLKNEVGAALERGKQVVPIIVAKGAVVPLMINRLQREDFTGDYTQALDKLVHRLTGGSRSESLRAMSPEDIERAAREAAARLAAMPAAERESMSNVAQQANLKLLMSKLDKNGDGVLTPDELRGLHGDSVPDSLAPVSTQRRETPRNNKRALWIGIGAAAACLGLVVALGVQDDADEVSTSNLPPPVPAAMIDVPAPEEVPVPEQAVVDPALEAEALRRAAALEAAQQPVPEANPRAPEPARARARRRFQAVEAVLDTMPGPTAYEPPPPTHGDMPAEEPTEYPAPPTSYDEPQP